MSNKSHLYQLLIALFSACFLLASCINDEHDETKGLAVGEAIPGFSVKAFIYDKEDWRYGNYGESVDLTTNAFSGKVGIIVFFNTGCEDCQKELPELQKVYDAIKGNSAYQFICISREEEESSIRSYWESKGFTLPYSAQNDRRVYNLFAQALIPRIYITNTHSLITHIHTDSPLADSETIIQEITASTP